MSRPSKPIAGRPLNAFMLQEFCAFAASWKEPTDFRRLGITFASNGYPLLGSYRTFFVLFRAAAYSDYLLGDSKGRTLFAAIYDRAPDMTLALMTHLREKLASASPHRRHILFAESYAAGPKEIWATFDKLPAKQDAVKAERRKRRQSVDAVAALRAAALDEWERSHAPAAPAEPPPKKRKRIR